ncbi:SPFH/Band 7/PHB domain protein, partial [uncultured virus]
VVDSETATAMTRQSAAERERRASILKSEGQRQVRFARSTKQLTADQADINSSEGRRQSMINVSEGTLQEKINIAKADAICVITQAEAQARSKEMLAEGQANAIAKVAEAMQKPGGMAAVRQSLAEGYLRALPESVRHARLIVWPENVGDVNSVVAKALALAHELPSSVDAVQAALSTAPPPQPLACK